MITAEEYENKVKELLNHIGRKRESLQKLRYRMEATKETSTNPTTRNLANLWEFVSAMFEESYEFHELYINAFEMSRKYLEKFNIWIAYFREVMPSLKSKMGDAEKRKLNKLEARLKEIEEYKPFLEHISNRIREALEKEKRKKKDIGRIIS